MPIFEHPSRLQLIKNFTIPQVKTWGSSNDKGYRELVRATAALSPDIAGDFDWVVFSIRARVAVSRNKPRQIPDVENIPKLIVDAFTGVLYEDDNLNYVRGVQVEAEWGADEDEWTEVWIYGKPRKT